MQNLLHSPADIIRWLLVDMGLGLRPGEGAVWPVYASGEPPAPDNCITVYDTTGYDSGRAMVDGSLLGFNGFQVRVRSVDHSTGWLKADQIQRTLAEGVYQETVHVGSSTYLIHAVSKIGDVMALGKDTNSKRSLFTINAVASVRHL